MARIHFNVYQIGGREYVLREQVINALDRIASVIEDGRVPDVRGLVEQMLDREYAAPQETPQGEGE